MNKILIIACMLSMTACTYFGKPRMYYHENFNQARFDRQSHECTIEATALANRAGLAAPTEYTKYLDNCMARYGYTTEPPEGLE